MTFSGTPQNPFERPAAEYFLIRGYLPCDGCNKNCFQEKSDYYMVRDEVWIGEAKLWHDPDSWKGHLAQRRGEKVRFCILCIACLEGRLGRKLTVVDFDATIPVNKNILAKLGPRCGCCMLPVAQCHDAEDNRRMELAEERAREREESK